MKILKFTLLHIAIDVFFLYGVLKIVYYWMMETASFAVLTPFIFLLFFGSLSIYNLKNQSFINCVADVFVGFFLFLFYKSATKTGYDILQSDIWFIVLLRGIVGLCIGLGLFFIFKNVICAYLKTAQIYSLSQDRPVSFLEAFLQPITKFKYTAAVPVVTAILHKVFLELFEFIKSDSAVAETQTSESQDNESDTQVADAMESETTVESMPVSGNNVASIFSAIKETKILKASTALLKIYVSYLDECTLAYCYEHPDAKFLDSSLKSIQIAIIHAPAIIGKIAVISAVNYIIKFVLYVTYVICLIKWIPFNLLYYVLSFLVVKCLHFIVQDALCEPLLMSNVLSTFCSFEISEEEHANLSFDKVKEMSPSFSKLGRFN